MSKQAIEGGLAERAKRGEYELIEPLDSLIMKMLPEEGTLFGGLYPLGETTKNITNKLNQGRKDHLVQISSVSTRMRMLGIQGLVVKQRTAATTDAKMVWQRTPRGSAYLASKEGAK